MFGGSWGTLASSTENLSDKERSRPARPVPLEFPSYIPTRRNSPLNQKHIGTVCKTLVAIRRLTDIQDSHLAQLNIQIDQDVSLSALVPDKGLEQRPLLYDGDLTAMLDELEVDNEDAYREVLRMSPIEGRKKPRLAYSRNFFVSLEDMSRYWDNSKDNYYEVDDHDSDKAGDNANNIHNTANENVKLNGSSRAGIAPRLQQPQPNDNVSGSGSVANPLEHSVAVELPTRPKTKQVYKGQRLGNGEQMGAGTRVGVIRNLLKMALHKFNCRDYDVSPREKLRIQNIVVPAASYNFCVAKLPTDTKLLRARMVEGPLMAVYCRNEVRFKPRKDQPGPNQDFFGEKFDLFREIGGMLLLAKQRSREGQTPSLQPGEDQWWAVKSRWGGGATRWGQLANEVFEAEDPSWSPEEKQLQWEKEEREEKKRRQAEAAAAADLQNLQTEDLLSGPVTPSSERPKKKKKSGEDSALSRNKAEYKDGKKLVYVPPLRRKWYQEWVKIRPNGPCWDEKLIPRAVGKTTEGENRLSAWDDIYMISSVNHHACILKMSVHENYLEWLENGREVNQISSSESKQAHVLYVSRSAWFDLFEVEQRKELLIGIWRILSWSNRAEVPKEEVEKMEELKKDKQRSSGYDQEMEL